MPRTSRASLGGICYHVINRGNARAEVFRQAGDYQAFVELLRESAERVKVRVLAYCLMSNHFHVAVCPRVDGDLSRWMQWLLTAHVRAGLVARAGEWLWSSLREWGRAGTFLDAGPVPRPADWVAWVNEAMTGTELERVRQASTVAPPLGARSGRWGPRGASVSRPAYEPAADHASSLKSRMSPFPS